MANAHQGIQVEQQIPVDQLTVGMFVCDLDRPWLDTPFLIQGFLIEDEVMLAQLQQLCREVVIDLSRSNLEDNSSFAIPARAQKGGDAPETVVRVITAPRAFQRPPQTRGWLSRFMQGLNELRAPIELPPAPEAAEGNRSTNTARTTVTRQASVVSRPAPSGRPTRERPELPRPARSVEAPIRPPQLSGNLLDWLKDGLGRLRVEIGRASCRERV